ncbi:uncharacterized protein LOC112568514 [Pomacea canaliculata]|uniref:uncharacterized protein LOC112568514 n=1 Tax=Pomacea canaliculata TaxID=400727 RepID=UPI000D733B08|nr:uncharacterized protein LOC112568514 [Pomacea canaliculata]
MIGSSKLTTYVLAPLLIGIFYWTPFVSGQGCTTTELNAIRNCISPYSSQLSPYFSTGGTCNRTLITQVCSDYSAIVTCVNGASLSTSTCRPYMITQMDAELAISCKVNDFVVTCTNASQLNEGSPNQGCDLTELTAIRQCISPYSTNLISYFGRGGTCNRTLITQQGCSNYGNIVTCVNNASLSTTTCRPVMVSQMDNVLAISCKVNDFVGTCTSAPQLNEGSPNQGCDLTELTAIRQSISPYSTDLISYFGRGGTCNRTFITQQVCSNYGNIVTCVNSASLSTTTCRPYMVSQMDNVLGISCKINDFAVNCTNAPKINEGSGGASCLNSAGAHAIFVAMVTHVILAVFAFPVRNS